MKKARNHTGQEQGVCEDDAMEVKNAMLNMALTGDDDYDALNPLVGGGGQMAGSHETNINEQTNLNLGAVANPGGLDPAQDRQMLKNMKENIQKHQ
ncbi:MAG TPA: hypothetical protein VEC37_08495 [Bacillota bacterium]|nr:hypothetical protein [Bacillota bacterium]